MTFTKQELDQMIQTLIARGVIREVTKGHYVIARAAT